MNSIWTIAVKDLVQLRRDRMGMFFIVVFPIAMAFFFGLIGASVQSDSARMTVAIVDEDRSDASRLLIEELSGSGQLEIVSFGREDALERVRRGRLAGAVVVYEGFEKRVGLFWDEPPRIGLGVDPSRKAEAGMLQGLVLQATGKLSFERLSNPETFRPLLADARRKVDADEEMPATIKPLVQGLMGISDQLLERAAEQRRQEQANAAAGNDGGRRVLPEMRLVEFESLDVVRSDPRAAVLTQIRSAWDISFPQAMLWGILGCVAGFAISIVRERTQGTWVRLRLAPVSLSTIIAGKTWACFLAVLGVIVLLTAVGVAVGMRPRNPAQLAVAALANAVCFVGLMMLMSSVGRTEEAVSGGTWGVNLFMSMFGGGMVPLAFLPTFMQTASNFSPVKWGILALEGAIWRGFTWGEMLTPCAILVAIGVVGFVLGTRALRRG